MLLRGSILHAEQIEYRYVWVRELRRHGAKHWPGSTGCFERECVQARSREVAASQDRDRVFFGRGEAAGDFVFTAEPCRTVAVDRTVVGPLPHR